MKKLFILLLALLSYTASAQISFFKDLNTEEDGSYPSNFIEVNGITFFTTREVDITKLWKTDGTENGTVQVSDQSIYISISFSLYTYNNELYYFVQGISDLTNISLWKTNGIEKTLVLANAGFVGKLYFFNNEVYFVRSDGFFKITNGEIVTILNWPINTSVDGFYPINSINNQLILFTNQVGKSNNTIFQVWKSDGTQAGTTIIKSVDSLATSLYSPNDYDIQAVTVGNQVYFMVKRLIFGPNNSFIKTVIELWKTDGIQTIFLKTIFSINSIDTNSSPIELANFNNNLIFIFNNTQFWISDGIASGTKIIKNFSYLPPDNYSKKWGMLNNKLYFSALENNDVELWQSDGTEVGTVLFKNLNPTNNSTPNFFNKYQNKLFFKANNNEIWQTDGTDIGTKHMQTLTSSIEPPNFRPEFIYTINNQLLFSNYDTQYDYELWKNDNQNTGLLKNIVTYSKGSLASSKKIKVENVWFFNGKDHRGGELWKTDGTEAGTVIVKDINPGPFGVIIREMVAVGTTIYFTAIYTNENNIRLFKSDGTESGTVEIPLSSGNQYLVNPNTLVVTSDGKLFFVGYSASGTKLWVINESGTNPYLIQATPGTSMTSRTLTAVGNKVFFNANGLWGSDGTEIGTYKILSNNGIGMPSGPLCLIEFKGKLYFLSSYYTGNGGKTALFESDGTVAGTKIVKDFEYSENLLSEVNLFLQKTDNRLFFRTFNNLNSPKSINLWTSDGTTQGTYQLKNISSEYHYPDLSFAIIKNQFYLFSKYRNFGTDLIIWTSDGTVDGTIQIYKKPANSSFLSTINFYGRLFFSYYDQAHGTELFKINQTNTEVNLAGEIRNGGKNSFVYNLMDFPDKILFWGTDETHGSEIWQYLPMDCEGNRNYTKQSGSWVSPDTWTCGRVPTAEDTVLIKSEHSVSVPNNYIGQLKSLMTQTGGVLDIPKGSVLLVKP